jgi:hypothetical protein
MAQYGISASECQKEQEKPMSKSVLHTAVRTAAAGVLALIGLTAITPSHADIVEFISPGDSWKYICTDSSAPCLDATGFEMPSYDDSGWAVGNAPFSNVGDTEFAANTNWTADFDPFVRKVFHLDAPIPLLAEVGVDNGYALYVNGTLVSADNAEGFTFRWEYTFPIPQNLLVAGDNLIAVALEDHGGLTAFDMRLTGEVAAVPEPGTIALLISGAVVSLAALRRRK